MKYIDAEKLITEIKRQQRSLILLSNTEQVDIRRDCALQNGVYDYILSIIDSLQQEQPFPHWIHANYSDKPEIRYTPSGIPYLQNGTHMIWLSDLDTLPKDGTELTNHVREQSEIEMKSPFTGGKVTILSREEEVTFRGEKIKVTRNYYRCVDSGREFTDGKLDYDMMWAVFRAYCEKKGMTSFTDIMLKQEQPEVDLEKEIDRFWDSCIKHKNERGGNVIWSNKIEIEVLARNFYELGLNERKEE